MPVVFETPREMLGQEGRALGVSDWLLIDQSMIDAFAALTGDDQWIHVDPERAARGPFGKTIAHGYFTLSLVNGFLPQLVEVRGFSAGVNVGSDYLRFVAPAPVDSRVRATGEIRKVEVVKGDAVQATYRITVEIEGGERPAVVVDAVARYFP
ncbi:MaoC family dehydratase [Brevundimonas sp.]|uniref:MaoC family dehydratase n=1 Tax=Brevundimonas sp. TaxID=1871086 RepID=UPI003D6D5CDB